jgi:2-polyprenyl-6-methoxyphenol hydroxylase-like FAD-dependent oxidoreductase
VIDFDFIFIGAGLSGLTLAQELSKSVGRNLALVDPRQEGLVGAKLLLPENVHTGNRRITSLYSV